MPVFKVLTILVVVSITLGHNDDTGDINKRLLLSDPDIEATRLANVEAAIQNLMGEVSKLKVDLQTEQTRNVQHETKISQMTQSLRMLQEYGSSYIRWGRTQCNGANSELVYSGYAAGQIYYDSKSTTRFGGPGNMLCLPNNPELSNKTAPGNSNIYGSEFEENRFGHGSLQEDVPCALCRSRNSTTSVMIPGRKTCYKGWNIEYNGLLASSCNHCKASSYVCVDKNPEYIPGGETDDNHNLLYTTGTICGSLPCPPYHNNLELFCVVCSK